MALLWLIINDIGVLFRSIVLWSVDEDRMRCIFNKASKAYCARQPDWGRDSANEL
jgi:hypothetical protein